MRGIWGYYYYFVQWVEEFYQFINIFCYDVVVIGDEDQRFFIFYIIYFICYFMFLKCIKVIKRICIDNRIKQESESFFIFYR